MKKILFSLGVMLSAFALTNCTQEIENPAQQPESAGYPFEIVASTVDTKTVNDGMSTKWVDGDKINLFHAVTDSTDYKNNGAFTVKDVEAGSFTGNLIETLDVEEEYDWFAFYPYSSYIKTPANTQNGYMPVGSKSSEVQTQTGNNNMTHIAGGNYPIAGRAIAVPASSTPSIKMTHVTSLVEVVVTNKTQNPLTVNEIMFVAPEDIIGTFYIDFSGDACSFISSGAGYTSSTATLKVNDAEALAQGQSAKFYLAVKPFKMTGTEGSSLSVYVNGYPKELNINKAISFLPGKIKTLNVAYDKVEEAGIEEATLTFDDKAKRVEYSTSIQVWKENGITVTNNKASSTTNVGDYYKPARFYKNSEVVISAPGMIKEIIINCSGMESKYVTPWGGNEVNGIVTMSLDGTSESVKYVMSSGQARANSVTVRYLPTSGGETPAPSVLSSIAVSGQTTSYTVGDNFEFDGIVTATYSDATTATVTPTSVSSPDMLTEGTKEVTVTYTEDGITCEATYNITIIASQTEEPEGPKVVTAAEFNAATDNNIEYQVSGTISGIYQAYDASYKNISLYISDGTGEILAYRLSCDGITDPANTLTKGDLITVKGKRTLYNEKPQMAQGCVIVEHKDVVVETPTGSATLSFANKANRTTYNTSQQVWEQNGIKFINDKAASTNNVGDYAAPVRLYQGSKLTVMYTGMTKIEFTCNNSSYATELKNSIKSGTVTVSGSVVTVVFDSTTDEYVVDKLAKQVRMDSITVYAE